MNVVHLFDQSISLSFKKMVCFLTTLLHIFHHFLRLFRSILFLNHQLSRKMNNKKHSHDIKMTISMSSRAICGHNDSYLSNISLYPCCCLSLVYQAIHFGLRYDSVAKPYKWAEIWHFMVIQRVSQILIYTVHRNMTCTKDSLRIYSDHVVLWI